MLWCLLWPHHPTHPREAGAREARDQSQNSVDRTASGRTATPMTSGPSLRSPKRWLATTTQGPSLGMRAKSVVPCSPPWCARCIRAVHLGHVGQRVLNDLIQGAHSKHPADGWQSHGSHPAADWISERIREFRSPWGSSSVTPPSSCPKWSLVEGWCLRASRKTFVGRNQGGVLRGADCSKSMISLQTEFQTAWASVSRMERGIGVLLLGGRRLTPKPPG